MGIRPSTASTNASNKTDTVTTPATKSGKFAATPSRLGAPKTPATKPSEKVGGISSRGGPSAPSPRGKVTEEKKIGGGLRKPTGVALKSPAPIVSKKIPDRASTSMGISATKTPSKIGGLKAPSTLDKKEVSKPTAASGKKPLPASAVPAGPKSAETDVKDAIYDEEDPIGITVDARKKAGSLTSTVPSKNKSSYFYSLK